MVRNEKFDLLRVIAAFMVVLLHVSASYVNRNISNPNFNFTIGNFYNSITRTCVPIFVMLSGTFLLDNSKNRDYKYFYTKTYKKIIIPTIIWSFVYFIFSMLIIVIQGLKGEEVNYLVPLINWIKGQPYYHLWYLYMTIGLYMITPILIVLKVDIGDENFFKLGIGLLLLGIIISLTSNLFWPIKFINYLGYFILGYSIRKRLSGNSFKLYISFIVTIISALLIFIVTENIVFNNIKMDNPFYFYGNLSPFVVIGSVTIFSVFCSMKDVSISPLINKFAKNSFNIYILHAGILFVLEQFLSKILRVDLNPIWFIPFLSILVFILSYIGSVIIEKIMRLNLFSNVREKSSMNSIIRNIVNIQK